MIKIFEVGKIKEEEIFARNEPVAEVGGIVSEIINNVKTNGDKALSEYLEKFDKVKLTDFKVSEEEIASALNKVEPEFLEILKEAESNIRAFHEKQVRQGFMMTAKNGVILGQRVVPIEKVGIYVPGGSARSGENSEAAVLREIVEETGLDIAKHKGKLIYSYKNEDTESGDNYFVDIYHFKGCFDKSSIKVNPDEVIDYRFVDEDDMEILKEEEGFLHYERIKRALGKM